MSDEIGEISTSSNGAGLDIEWKIGGFFYLSTTGDAYYCSPVFSFDGQAWYLGIYPNGDSSRDSTGHINVYLIKYLTIASTRQAFSLSLKTAKGEKYREKHSTKVFERAGDFHEFHRFLPRSELTRRSSELVPQGVLTVVCTMKSTVGIASNAASASADCCPTLSDCDSDTEADTAVCCHCKGTFETKSLSWHQKKCMHRPIKCPNCLDVVVLQKWLDEHVCQKKRPEAGKGFEQNSENTYVNAFAQTVEENAEKNHKANSENTCVESFTQTGEENGLEKLNCDFQEIFLNGHSGDVVLKVSDQVSREHKCVLAARSPAFLALIMHGTKDKISGVVDIQDVDRTIFSDFINYLYTGRVENQTSEKTLMLYTVADKYQASELKKICLNHMSENISVDNFCDVFTLSLRHEEKDLKEVCVQFFAENSLDIIFTSRWQTFLTENPIIGNELFIKHIQLNKLR